jgi:hypothetical protein
MTRADRDELRRALRAWHQVAKADLKAVKAERLAAFEEQIATIYNPYDEAWADARRRADAVAKELQAVIDAEMDARGVPPAFRPIAGVHMSGRGENETASRRAELRKVAMTRLDADEKDALAKVQRAIAERELDLVAGALETVDAAAWLDRLPQPEALIAPLDIKQLEQEIKENLPPWQSWRRAEWEAG